MKCYRVMDIHLNGAPYQVYISDDYQISPDIIKDCCIFIVETEIHYEPFCHDFGPMNFIAIVEFCCILDEKISTSTTRNIVLTTKNGPRGFTNAAFLLGAYMILKLRMSPDSVQLRFSKVDKKFFEAYRDATYEEPDFKLHLIDCWRGLYQGRALKWITHPLPNRSEWGMIDPAEYAHYDNPLNSDMHEVVPGKFVAFKGPKDLGGRAYVDKKDGGRDFSPGHYASIFKALGVTTVIRLNTPQYNGIDFLAYGIQHFDLYFEDCTLPPTSLAHKFLQIAESAPGMVAVHCKAGLGRTGTLIALYMMKHHGFTARGAIGWLRIMRPGSVIGDQQKYLSGMELRLAGPQVQDPSARAQSRGAAASQALPAVAAPRASRDPSPASPSPFSKPRPTPPLPSAIDSDPTLGLAPPGGLPGCSSSPPSASHRPPVSESSRGAPALAAQASQASALRGARGRRQPLPGPSPEASVRSVQATFLPPTHPRSA